MSATDHTCCYGEGATGHHPRCEMHKKAPDPSPCSAHYDCSECSRHLDECLQASNAELKAGAYAVVDWEQDYRVTNHLGLHPPDCFRKLLLLLEGCKI